MAYIFNKLAKNLLEEKTCENCKHAVSLCTLEWFELNPDKFIEYTRFRTEDIVLFNDTIFMCHLLNKLLPKELTCEKWSENE